ncbi:Macrolide export ATP-binding/permease protein MacB [Phycisphaerales bacterium]|nr:Macrolide export ATP-binding/permease protein MacB [Phycisphaerales bacterium]
MRPAWRLAISSLSTRASRTALLIATVGLSAALIVAVSCTMNSMQVSAKRQVDSVVGRSDVRVRPSGGGQTLDESLLAVVQRWQGVERATGWLGAPITVTARVQSLQQGASGWAPIETRYTVTAVATGHADIAGFDEIELEAGELPLNPGEVVIDGSLAVRLSHAGAGARSPMDLPARTGGRRTHLSGPHPTLPDTATDPETASQLNARVGVRLGDEIEIARQVMPDVDISAVLADPKKAAEMAQAAGVKPSLSLFRDMLREPVRLKVVGISKPPPFGGRPQAFMTRETLERITGSTGRLRQIEVSLRPGTDPDSFVEAHRADLPEHVLMTTSGKITSKLDQNIEASRLGFLLATTMAFLAAGFIITTGMTTAVTERQRELGMLRCIGADRSQLAWSQLVAGALVGGGGALVGLPLGMGVALFMIRMLQKQIEINLHVPAWGLAMAAGGAVICGLAGAAYPAWAATRVSPLEALAARSVTPRRSGVLTLLAIGLALAAVQLGVVTLTTDGQWRFWLYVFLGLPALFVGYFLLAVPALALLNRLLAPAVTKILALPPAVLQRTVRATPYRYGFTAGSMMMGMALMVGIWTQGGAIQRDWIGRLQFPDAFVTGFNLNPASQTEIESIPGVTATCAITLHPVETDNFGVRGLQSYRSMFMAFEPETFFDMTNPVWIQGDRATATRRLNEGGAVIVAREFQIARGLGVGDVFTCRSGGQEFRFEIVGVVTSPGLEVVSQFFSIGEGFTDQSLHAVFGSRKDLKEKFGSDAIHLIQIAIAPDAPHGAEAKIVSEIKSRLAGAGILDAGSGRAVKEQIEEFVKGGLFGASSIALMTMFIAGFGVANLIVAGITARQYEFGVIQAVGGSRGLVARLVLGEAVLVGLTAAALGTLMGVQGVFAVQRIDAGLFGLDLHLRPPPGPLAIGWAITIAMTLLAAAPAVVALARKQPRELLGAVRG